MGVACPLRFTILFNFVFNFQGFYNCMGPLGKLEQGCEGVLLNSMRVKFGFTLSPLS